MKVAFPARIVNQLGPAKPVIILYDKLKGHLLQYFYSRAVPIYVNIIVLQSYFSHRLQAARQRIFQILEIVIFQRLLIYPFAKNFDCM